MPNAKMITTVLTGLMLLGAPIAMSPAMAQQSSKQVEVSESELDAFIVALKSVSRIEQDYGAQVQSVSDETEKQALVDEAQAKMTQAVEDAPNIEVDRYIEILNLVQTDPDLKAELITKLED